MKIEHFALNVPDARAMAAWWQAHLGMEILWGLSEAPHTHFIADSSHSVMLEIYSNPSDPIPDYTKQHHLRMHIAISSRDPHADADRLVKAGASRVEEASGPDGFLVVTLRDPWGVAFQFCRRPAKWNPIQPKP